MGLRKVIPFLLLFLLDSVRTQSSIHRTALDRNGKYYFSWDLPADTKGDSEIIMKMEVKAMGYITMGFSMDGTMAESDLVTCWVKDGQVYFKDRHTDADSVAIVDEQQDYTVINAFENDTHTVCEVRRKLDTCDVNDMVIHGGTMRVIYSFSDEDPESEDPMAFTENQGVKSVVLLKANKSPNLDYSSLSSWDVKGTSVELPAVPMYFSCKVVKSPELSEKNHIVSIQPMVQDGNEQYVLYLIMYECFGGTPEEFEDLAASGSFQCYGPERPAALDKCKAFTVMWVAGEQGLELPEHVGFPIDSTPKYYSFEAGYYNPQSQSGINDQSGFTVYYTNNLRENDGGNFLIGAPHSSRMIIPPGQEKYEVVGFSNPQCTSVFPESGINAVGIIPHAHLLGRGKTCRHFRGKEELMPLVNEMNFDVMIQETRFFEKERVIKPDDEIVMQCYYNTKNSPNVTFGGQMVIKEMCLAIIMYYPVVPGFCSLSVPTYDTINQALNIKATNEKEIEDMLGNYDWDNADIAAIQNAMLNSPQNSQCHFGTPTAQDEANDLVTYPSDYTPYVSESTCK